MTPKHNSLMIYPAAVYAFGLAMYFLIPMEAQPDLSGAAGTAEDAIDKASDAASGGAALVKIGNEQFALYGIRMPEQSNMCERGGQIVPCTQLAVEALAQRVKGGEADCAAVWQGEGAAPKSAICFGDDRSIASTLLSLGVVSAAPNAPRAYKQLEAKAREAGLGVWRNRQVPAAEKVAAETIAVAPEQPLCSVGSVQCNKDMTIIAPARAPESPPVHKVPAQSIEKAAVPASL